MAKKLFVLGIGGTGMRCIESLIHLCAMGMFDDTDLHLLALDTDKNNGNFSRLKALKDAYLGAKGGTAEQRQALQDTFFSANLKYYEFSPDYETKSSFKAIFGYSDTQFRAPEQTGLVDLMLSESVMNFNLRHGYRAQTHLGSMMMYHSILEEAERSGSGLRRFLDELVNESQSGNPRIFILGSVFGGTGASSIPIIPQALGDAVLKVSNGSVDLMGRAYFASTLLTAYFSFRNPTASELKEQLVIATSDKFALNSQVAMMFYSSDPTVRSTYQRFYMMGTAGLDWKPMAQEDNSPTITGGDKQENDSHYIELLAAMAAWDFSRLSEDTLRGEKSEAKPRYLYRSIEDTGVLEFQDFVGADYAEEFARKAGMLLVFSILSNGENYDFVASTQAGRQKEFVAYKDIDPQQVAAVKKYFDLFHVYVDAQGSFREGWIRQLHRSAGGGERFLFGPNIFSPNDARTLSKIKFNEGLYRNSGVAGGKGFSTGWFSNQFDAFKEEVVKVLKNNEPKMTNRGEQLYKMVYDALKALYKF